MNAADMNMPSNSIRPRQMLDTLLDHLPAVYREKILHPAKTIIRVWWKEQPLTPTLETSEEVVRTAFTKLSKLIGTIHDVCIQHEQECPSEESKSKQTGTMSNMDIYRYLNAVRVYLGELRERMTEGLYVHGYAWEKNVHAAVLDADTWLAFCQDLAFV